MQRVSTMMGGSGREGECPARLRDLLWELQVVEDALREVYDNDPLDFLAEGDERPELEAWCEAEGLELERVVALLHRELAPLHPGFAGQELHAVSAARLEALGGCLAGVCPAKLEIITPHVVGLLVRGLPTPENASAGSPRSLQNHRHPAWTKPWTSWSMRPSAWASGSNPTVRRSRWL